MNANIIFSPTAWNQFTEFHYLNMSEEGKIIDLIEDICKNGPLKGIGKPERLRYIKSGGPYYSRRITDKDRLVYKVDSNLITIIACKGHYDD